MLNIHARSTFVAITSLVAIAEQAPAQSFTIDPDGLGETNVSVDSTPLTNLNQLIPGVRLIVGVEPAGSLRINGPWTADSFNMRIGFASSLRLEGGVHLEGIGITSLGNGGGTSTVPGRIELDNSSLSAIWNLPFPGDINSLEYQLENNSHLSIDFSVNQTATGGWGMAPFELGLTDETIVTARSRDLRVTRVPTGSTVTVIGTTHITRASGAQVAANGHNIIIDGGVWEANRISGETLGDAALAEGGIDFCSGTIRIRDRYTFRFAGISGEDWDVWDTGRAFNQDAMNAMLAGVTPAAPTAPTLIAGQTLHFASWYNPFWIGNISVGNIEYENLPNETYIASTLEVRGGRLLLGPEGGWEASPSTPWSGYPNVPDFLMVQSGIIWDLDEDYTGPDPTGPFVLDDGQFDFTNVLFSDAGTNPVPNYYLPQFRAGTVRGRSLEFDFQLQADPIVFGAAGKELAVELSGAGAMVSSPVEMDLNYTPMHIADGATVTISAEVVSVGGEFFVGDGATVTLSGTLAARAFGFDLTLQVGLNSTLRIGTLEIGDNEPVTCDIGAGSDVELGAYGEALNGLTALSTGPGTLRLMSGALDSLAFARRAFTVGGNLELDSTGTLAFNLVAPTNATSYTVSGDLDLGGSGLSVTLADELFMPGEQTLIAIGGTATGTFAGIPEGTLIESRLGVDLYLSYAGGDGNDIVLTSAGPCPADTNGDGILDNGDIGVFINLFLAGDLAADMNGDGILDNGDIGTFINAFLAGC
ncbi:MAG: hypothetical protein ACI89L_002173 [Phycisphaerales bacterium]|jgi:hypothetical protein